MSYNPDSLPMGGNYGQEERPLHLDAPDFLARQSLAADPAAAATEAQPELVVIEQRQRPVDLVDANLERLKEVIAEMKAPLKKAIKDGDGFEPYHAADIARLDQMHQRIAHLIASFSFGEPVVNAAFVEEAMIGFNVLDGGQGQYRQDHTTWMQREAVLDQAVTAARAAGEEAAAV